MIKIIVATPKGELLNKDVDSIVASGDTGQVGILTNRLPLLMKITKGFVKVNSNETQYVGIVNGVIDFQDNIATVIAQTAAIGTSEEDAFRIIEENDLLIKNIKEMKAAHLD